MTWEPPAAPGSTRTNLICNTGVLNQPAVNRYSVPIKGTENRRLPKWMEPHRDRLTRFVRLNTEAGMVPMSDFKAMRISIGPKGRVFRLWFTNEPGGFKKLRSGKTFC